MRAAIATTVGRAARRFKGSSSTCPTAVAQVCTTGARHCAHVFTSDAVRGASFRKVRIGEIGPMVRLHHRSPSYRRLFGVLPKYSRFESKRIAFNLRCDHRRCIGADLVALDHPGSTCGRSVLASDLTAIRTRSVLRLPPSLPKDWLIIAFLALVTAATGSALLGTNFVPSMDARIPICIQFLLLGISFDTLRMFLPACSCFAYSPNCNRACCPGMHQACESGKSSCRKTCSHTDYRSRERVADDRDLGDLFFCV